MTYEEALERVLEGHKTRLNEARAHWLSQMHTTLDDITTVADRRLCTEHAAAVSLQVEMQRDLLDYMPDPTDLPGPDDGKRTSAAEPARARDALSAIARFVEWLLFRKYDIPAARLVELFNFDLLDVATRVYERALTRLEDDTALLMRDSREDRPPGRQTPELRLVATDDD